MGLHGGRNRIGGITERGKQLVGEFGRNLFRAAGCDRPLGEREEREQHRKGGHHQQHAQPGPARSPTGEHLQAFTHQRVTETARKRRTGTGNGTDHQHDVLFRIEPALQHGVVGLVFMHLAQRTVPQPDEGIPPAEKRHHDGQQPVPAVAQPDVAKLVRHQFAKFVFAQIPAVDENAVEQRTGARHSRAVDDTHVIEHPGNVALAHQPDPAQRVPQIIQQQQ